MCQSEVVLRQSGLGCVKSHLVASKPALIAQHGSRMDRGTSHVKVQVTAHIDIVTLVACLQLGTLLATEGRGQGEMKYESLSQQKQFRTSELV